MYIVDASVHLADARPQEPHHAPARALLARLAAPISSSAISSSSPSQVSTEALPFDVEEVPASEQASATEDPEPYLNEKADMLNGLAESDWEPDLSLLDSVLGSLRLETTSSGGDLLGHWQWQRSAYNNDTELVADDPNRYTVEFKADGTLDIQADCNQLSWTYTREGNSLTVNSLGATTLAFCGEDSMDQQFLEDLSEVIAYVMHEGNLVLNIRVDVGNMIFGR